MTQNDLPVPDGNQALSLEGDTVNTFGGNPSFNSRSGYHDDINDNEESQAGSISRFLPT